MRHERIRNLEATESTDLAGNHRKLTVTAEIEVGSTAETPKLAETVPQGINPQILLLDLTIEGGGIGADVMTWKSARFEKEVSENQHQSVEILVDGNSLASATVQVIHS